MVRFLIISCCAPKILQKLPKIWRKSDQACWDVLYIFWVFRSCGNLFPPTVQCACSPPEIVPSHSIKPAHILDFPPRCLLRGANRASVLMHGSWVCPAWTATWSWTAGGLGVEARCRQGSPSTLQQIHLPLKSGVEVSRLSAETEDKDLDMCSQANTSDPVAVSTSSSASPLSAMSLTASTSSALARSSVAELSAGKNSSVSGQTQAFPMAPRTRLAKPKSGQGSEQNQLPPQLPCYNSNSLALLLSLDTTLSYARYPSQDRQP